MAGCKAEWSNELWGWWLPSHDHQHSNGGLFSWDYFLGWEWGQKVTRWGYGPGYLGRKATVELDKIACLSPSERYSIPPLSLQTTLWNCRSSESCRGYSKFLVPQRCSACEAQEGCSRVWSLVAVADSKYFQMILLVMGANSMWRDLFLGIVETQGWHPQTAMGTWS